MNGDEQGHVEEIPAKLQADSGTRALQCIHCCQAALYGRLSLKGTGRAPEGDMPAAMQPADATTVSSTKPSFDWRPSIEVTCSQRAELM
ncbi:hypothetical protein PC116_g6117 [Phytophthora cactorum]|uniref:Uncharacterized protein n=1 Tax=Phytophthora cactorum TaxID=29920 RepID=A0A8T1LGW7_9STRA|nr:hypothetical protein Pcac1_g2653 [Phytophthora cactorum]KAG2840007.1 hypothetical protein PC111_g3673 [Phytophthora cactorum]KAG2923084.1 hypothetical protein PC114_g4974 [Phytophthora cactorum]KAG2937837.1 hypothetical protein PC115_g4031 [Phytophthora cactorum]KAG2951195.1 hypothetical protein PC117_g3813 [Phytophthora cactorum]